MEIIINIFVLWSMSKILRIEHICKSLHANDLRTHIMPTFIYKTEMRGLVIGRLGIKDCFKYSEFIWIYLVL